jgi:hypothetical protein
MVNSSICAGPLYSFRKYFVIFNVQVLNMFYKIYSHLMVLPYKILILL